MPVGASTPGSVVKRNRANVLPDGASPGTLIVSELAPETSATLVKICSPESSQSPEALVAPGDEELRLQSLELDEVADWRRGTLTGAAWFDDHAVNFRRHYTGSLACVPSRPTLFTGQYPDVHGVTQTNGLGKMQDDSRMRWLRA